MKFEPQTAAQMQTARLIPNDTECDFEVVTADNKTSKAGNDMIAVKLRVWHGEREAHVYDYLMATMGFKLLHFCEAAGLTDRYASGGLDASDCHGKTGRAVIGLEPASGNYAAKNTVRDYVGHRETKVVKVGASAPPMTNRLGPAAASPAASANSAADDIPF
jgi:hypothetical protein